MPNTPPHLVQIRIPDRLYGELRAIASREENHLAPVLRRLLSDAVAREHAQRQPSQEVGYGE